MPTPTRSLPTSILATEPDVSAIEYVDRESLKPTAPYGGWDPNDHFLSFPTKVISPRTVGRQLQGSATDPTELDTVIEWDYGRALEGVRRALVDGDYVADQRGPRRNLAIEYTLSVRVKAWPAVPGVTVPELGNPYR